MANRAAVPTDPPTSSANQNEFGLRLEWPEQVDEAETAVAPRRAPAPTAGAVVAPGMPPAVAPPAAVGDEVATLRQALLDLSRHLAAADRAQQPQPAQGLSALAPLIEEITLLRTEVLELKRRVRLRAEARVVQLDVDQMDQLAAEVAERVINGLGKGSRATRRR